jgi:hypothetical protein
MALTTDKHRQRVSVAAPGKALASSPYSPPVCSTFTAGGLFVQGRPQGMCGRTSPSLSCTLKTDASLDGGREGGPGPTQSDNGSPVVNLRALPTYVLLEVRIY